MRTQTRSQTPCASPSRDSANGSANPGSSPPWPASGTASTRNQTPRMREESVDRRPGLSVRLKLTLSYAGFLMLAGALLLAVGYVSLSRGVHPGVIFMVRSHADLLRDFAPTAAVLLGFLLVFGLLGGWLLDRLHTVNSRAIDLTEALLLLSRTDQRSFTREHIDLSLIAEEAAETLLPLAEARGIAIETSGEMTPTIGSHVLLLQLSTNLLHNAI